MSEHAACLQCGVISVKEDLPQVRVAARGGLNRIGESGEIRRKEARVRYHLLSHLILVSVLSAYDGVQEGGQILSKAAKPAR